MVGGGNIFCGKFRLQGQKNYSYLSFYSEDSGVILHIRMCFSIPTAYEFKEKSAFHPNSYDYSFYEIVCLSSCPLSVLELGCYAHIRVLSSDGLFLSILVASLLFS